jgi:diguanylate cyclase (GGDEF)-like protein
MKRKIKKILKIEDYFDEQISEINRVILLPVENMAKIGIIRTILDRIKVNVTKSHYDSIIDKATGLLNKNCLEKMFETKLTEALNKGMYLTLVVTDINFLKKFNDILGHLVGDIVIKQYANVIKKSLRKSDLAFRYGGDEFVLICVHKKLDDANIIINRIKANNKILNETFKYPFSASIGHAVSEINSKPDFKELFDKADKMLYEMKKEKVLPDFGKYQVDGD